MPEGPLQGFMLMKAAFCFILLSGCAYSYAGQNGEQSEEKEERQNVSVITLETQKDDVVEPEKKIENVQTSRCGLSRFSIFWRKGNIQKEHVVDCETRKIIAKKSTQTTDVLTHPEAVWYFYVDPHDVGKAEINNTHLLKLSQQFRIEFFGQEGTNGVLIYTFLDRI